MRNFGPIWFTFFYHLISITHHSKYQGCLVPSLGFHHSLFFKLFRGSTPVKVQPFFFFFFPSTQQPEPSEKKKKKTVKKTEPVRKKKKKKSQLVKSCGWVGPSCVFNYKNVIELWVMKTENSQKVFSVSITHNSKIRELSDGNKKLKIELWLAKQIFFWELRWVSPFLRIELWKLRIEWWELMNQTAP